MFGMVAPPLRMTYGALGCSVPPASHHMEASSMLFPKLSHLQIEHETEQPPGSSQGGPWSGEHSSHRQLIA